MSLNIKSCITRPTLTDLNPAELNYYPFMFSLDKCSGNCNSNDDISTKICTPSKIKDINVKLFNMITNKNEAKKWQKILHETANANVIVQLAIQIKNQCRPKKYRKSKKDYSWNPSTSTCENSRYLKHIVDVSVIVFDEIIYIKDIVSKSMTNMKNTISANVTSIVSLNFNN